MDLNRRQPATIGIALIALGVIWWLNLWWLLWPGALAVGGVAAYLQRRRMGRMVEAVQVGLWGIGLALLFLLHFVWPGILFLAGTSLLIRGRELAVDAWVQRTLAGRAMSRASIPTQQVPITSTGSGAAPITSETTRLHE